MNKDALGERMKRYEQVTKNYLTRKTYTILRIDGKAFHTYTRGLEKPFDEGLTSDMNETAKYLCENIQGAKLAYVQSDEISVVLTDFDTIETQAWFDYELQKVVSVSASLATAKFNQLRSVRKVVEIKDLADEFANDYEEAVENEFLKIPLAHFDSRAFQVPTQTEAINYLVWRQKDCMRNSVSSVAQANFSSKELHGVSTQGKLEMLSNKGVEWESYGGGQKCGRMVVNELETDLVRTSWNIHACPIINFEEGNFIFGIIPKNT